MAIFSPRSGDAGHPAFPSDAAAVTKSDVTVFDKPSVVFVGTAGTATVVTEAGSTVAFKVPAGGVIPVMVVQVKSTGTDAADMVRVFQP